MAKIQPKLSDGTPNKKIFQRLNFIKSYLNKKRNILVAGLFLVISCLALITEAKAALSPLNVEFTRATSASDFSQLVGNFLKWILTVAGSLAMLIIIIGGVMYISSSGDEQKTVLSKKIVLGAIGGLILVLIAYSIITLLGGIV